MTPIRVVIADDHPVIITALKAMVAAEPDLEVVGSFGDAESAAAFLSQHDADVLVLDLSLPPRNGVSLITGLQQLGSPVRVVVWTAGMDAAEVVDSVRQGASAVVLKQMPPEYLLHCIRKVFATGEADPESIRRSLDALQRSRREPDEKKIVLSRREIEVAVMVARGLSNAEIGKRLGVGLETVKTHLQNSYAKLGIATRVELSMYAKEKGLI